MYTQLVTGIDLVTADELREFMHRNDDPGTETELKMVERSSDGQPNTRPLQRLTTHLNEDENDD